MTLVLSDDQLDQIARGDTHLGAPTGTAPHPTGPPPTRGVGLAESEFRLYRPLAAAADEYVRSALTRDQRIETGLAEFDAAMRGLGPKELMIVQGFAHSGKTLWATQMLWHNRDRRIVLFTPDESRVLVLLKLASLVSGVSAETLENMIAGHNPAGERVIREAADHFPHLAVFDDIADWTSMHRACDEASAAHGGEPELVLFDYADLYQGGDSEGGTPQKINNVKAWGKDRDVPFVLLHQTSRSSGKGGQTITIDSGAYGGEQQATFVIGVRRKREQYAAQARDLQVKLNAAKPAARMEIEEQITECQWLWRQHADTITFNLVKNKRPPSRLVDEQDYHLDPLTGRLTHLDAVVPAPSVPQQPAPVSAGWEQPSFGEEF